MTNRATRNSEGRERPPGVPGCSLAGSASQPYRAPRENARHGASGCQTPRNGHEGALQPAGARCKGSAASVQRAIADRRTALREFRRKLAALLAVFDRQLAKAARGFGAAASGSLLAALCSLLIFLSLVGNAQAGALAVGDSARPAALLAEMPSVSPTELGMLLLGLATLAMIYKMLNGAKTQFIDEVLERVQSKAGTRSEPHRIEQPLDITTRHPCVDHPTFQRHTTEVWIHINDHRNRIADLAAATEAAKQLAEARTLQLNEISRATIATGEKVSHLAGLVEKVINQS